MKALDRVIMQHLLKIKVADEQPIVIGGEEAAEDEPVIDGGKGSGNFGHKGRAGQVGGSGEGGADAKTTEAINSGIITSAMKEQRKQVQIRRPSRDEAQRRFEELNSKIFEHLNSYQPRLNAARERGDTAEYSAIQTEGNKAWRDKQAQVLKDLGTYMEDGYYVTATDMHARESGDKAFGDILVPDTVNTELGCFNMRPVLSSTSRDNIEAVYLSDKYIKISEDEAKAILAERAIKNKEQLTLGGVSREEERALSTYTYAVAAASAMRKGEYSKSAEVIQDVISRTVSPERTLFRGVQGDYARELASMEVGDEIEEKSFMSTSFDVEVADKFAGDSGVVMKIHTPSGYGITMSIASVSQKPDEAEVLVQAGKKFKLVKKTGRELEFEMVDSHKSTNDSAFMNYQPESDGGEGSGNFNHGGREGQIGGSTAGGKGWRKPKLSSKEIAAIHHELNTNLSKEDFEAGFTEVNLFGNTLRVEIIGFDEYNILSVRSNRDGTRKYYVKLFGRAR